MIRRILALAPVVLLLSGLAAAAEQAATIHGRVLMAGSDQAPAPLPGVAITLEATEGTAEPLSAWTDGDGAFQFGAVLPGTYLMTAALEGFEAHRQPVAVRGGQTLVVDMALRLAAVEETVTVLAKTADAIESRAAAPAPTLSQATLQAVPLAREQFVEALPLVPGVVRGPDGLLNVKGARTSQSGLTVNSANVTDPVTGEYALNLPLEAIQTVQVLTNPYAPEYGKFSGGVTAIETRTGGDAWRLQVQNFMPRLRRRDGQFRGIEAFTPRLTVGGPLAGPQLTLLQSFQYRLTRTEVESLPPLERDMELESVDSYTRLDWHPGTLDHLTASVSLFPQTQRFAGLNTFNPRGVTPNFEQRGFFVAGQYRRVLGGTAVSESFASAKRFDADVFPSSGREPMRLLPDRNAGSFFNTQSRDSLRVEGLQTVTLSPRGTGDTHVVKVGAGVSASTFDGRYVGRPVEILRADGSLAGRIGFEREATLGASSTEWLAFVQDAWTPLDWLTVEYGVRYDWDSITSSHNIAPRAAVAYRPPWLARSVVRAGVGLFYDKTNLNVASFDRLPVRTVATFPADEGAHPVSFRQTPLVAGGRVRAPRSTNWNVEFDREWLPGLVVGLAYQRRTGVRELIVDRVPDGEADEYLRLGNGGRSSYDEFRITGRQRVGRALDLVASYVRSSAVGDLNDVNSLFGNFPNPVILPNERTRLGWDAPHRFVAWSDLALPYRIELAPVLEVRSGFPLTAFTEERTSLGPRNGAGRFPVFASLDLQAVKAFRLPGPLRRYQAKAGVRVFNLLNRFNPRDFQGVLGSSAFGQFFNGVGRTIRGRFVIDF
ncbi:MAG: carboxypeptidase regulatory-like domain-containing protein [Acidobacteriota bacterium]